MFDVLMNSRVLIAGASEIYQFFFQTCVLAIANARHSLLPAAGGCWLGNQLFMRLGFHARLRRLFFWRAFFALGAAFLVLQSAGTKCHSWLQLANKVRKKGRSEDECEQQAATCFDSESARNLSHPLATLGLLMLACNPSFCLYAAWISWYDCTDS